MVQKEKNLRERQKQKGIGCLKDWSKKKSERAGVFCRVRGGGDMSAVAVQETNDVIEKKQTRLKQTLGKPSDRTLCMRLC